ncbi:hypothetical protein WR25_13377 isoform E [Diploscapter pachys]|uniref:FERM domain-containing protein n=1 Tax=Diploscapter pachys TaxID=2018661 RepID=A0A2A2J3Q2_9BILA|nr:hypothetical protein WR25_13377 isoform C [Diploscapter pachys]PAV56142.1 hypothetical protein WR25_13377 isoform D [Diploscapter pachys]PAV56143.1 hypothetical protein WR25_13377 isoform E [Diploscapter pachys]
MGEADHDLVGGPQEHQSGAGHARVPQNRSGPRNVRCQCECLHKYVVFSNEIQEFQYFEIRNKKGTELYLGVDALGLNIYEKHDRLSPKVGFPWSEIRNISFNDRKFVIKPIDKKANDFVFYAPRLRINKRILALCMGNHELYMRRRKPDTIEVQQMKQQARDERALKLAEQERLNKEMNAREQAETRQKEAEERMQRMLEDMERAKRELAEAHSTIHSLEAQLKQLQLAKEALESKEMELRELTAQLQSEKAMSEDERRRLRDEVARREDEVYAMRTAVQHQQEETNRMQDEMARRKENDRPMHDHHGHTKEYMHSDEEENGHTDLTTDADMHVHQNELNRISTTEQNVNIRQKLDMLTRELEGVKDERGVTDYDVLHMENKKAGRDKYKTLRQIRGGNTKRRIDQYENM